MKNKTFRKRTVTIQLGPEFAEFVECYRRWGQDKTGVEITFTAACQGLLGSGSLVVAKWMGVAGPQHPNV